MERTFIMIKPDGVQRQLIGEIVGRFEKKGFKLVAMKVMTVSQELAEKHYEALNDKPYIPGVDPHTSTSPDLAMVWEGNSIVSTSRQMIGATDPHAAAPGTIRGDYGVSVGRNIIHGSDAIETAKREISLWFKDEEVNEWDATLNPWLYE